MNDIFSYERPHTIGPDFRFACPRIITVEERERLLSLDFIEGLALRITALNLSRIRTTDWLADKIYGFNGTIYGWDGRPLYIDPDIIDRSYGQDETCTWNSEVKVFARRPPLRRPRHSMLLRLALWDAAMKMNGTPVL
ncbi:hypothetical protein [Sphingobium sp. HWE2-09]|uniref:hypothetical protein n=1 Tax=Sphingobium sp. HWE2-09 TaxID=3108390 RepID=UPI002DC1D704|nr:hypothetical protein [Sphingobium sp. HWE2-09]